MLLATASAFLPPFMASALNIALPSIGAEFALDAVTLSWVATSYLLATAVFMVPFGRVADMYGRKRIFALGMAIYTVASLLLGFSASAGTLIAWRVLQGLGSAMIFGTGVAVLISVFPPGERGRVIGINVAAVYLGLSLGPFLGGLLTEHLGWRSIFLVTVPPALGVLAAIIWKLKGEWAEARGERFDMVGSVLYSLALVALIFGLSMLPSWGAVLLMTGGMGGLVAFVRWETRSPFPVLNINVFRQSTVFTFSSVAALISYAATFAVSFLLSLYLQYAKGFTPEITGLVLVSMPATQAVFSPLAGRLSDRVEPRVVASIGMGVTTAALGMFIFLNLDTATGYILATLISLGFGFALFSSPNTNAILSSVEKRFYGVASGILGTTRLIGQMLSMGIAMVIFAVYLGRVQITQENVLRFTDSLQVAFIIFTALCFAGIFASLARGKMR